MRPRVRSALRVCFLTVLVLSATAVGQSFVQATSGDYGTGTATPPPTVTPTETATPTPTPSESDEADDTVTTRARTETTPTATPPSTGLTGIDLESRFDRAKDGPLPGENWSAERVREASGRRGLTVVATQGFYKSGQTAEIAAFTPNGTVVYFNDSYRVYFDVDPVRGERYTVEYVAARHFEGAACEAFDHEECSRNVVIRANLTTGEQEVIYAEMTPRIASARWHDVDRINETRLVVADIVNDSVYAVDTRDGEKVWEWSASEHYARDQGGNWADWTHINDVEVLPDGRIMASPRNMDEVIFLEPTGDGYAVNDTWTLGVDENHSILYEQHNPDYIPRAYGGPSVIVADSENQRVIEYHRSDGEWERAWSWRDVRLTWPRDADRLPNGNTLIVDSNGNRLVELNAADEVVWSVDLGMPYDAERIGTGDESTGGPAARLRSQAPITPRTPTTPEGDESADSNGSDQVARPAPVAPADATATASDRPPVDRFWFAVKDAIPSLLLNSVLYAAPPWVLFTDLMFATLFVLVGCCWAGSEFYWSAYTLRGLLGRLEERLGTLVARVR